MEIIYTRVSSEEELHQILALQKKNAFTAISSKEKQNEGFVTVSHSYELLKQMNDACQHIIAKDGALVVGYALAMLPSFRNEIPLLVAMFETADVVLSGKNYIVMGQICIAKSHRQKGIFKGMYQHYKKELQNKFDGLITEVATVNQRSLNAHKSIGFEVLKTQTTDEASWELIYWNWS